MRLTTLLAAACAAVLFLPSAARATTANGAVAGAPVVHGRTAVVPVLLGTASARALHLAGRSATLSVPVAGGLRGPNGRLTPGQLRLGDRVTLQSARRVGAGRIRAAVLRVRIRGTAPSFDAIAQHRADLVRSTEGALAELSGAPAITDAVPAALRTKLLHVRTDVNLVISDLRAEGTDDAGRTADDLDRAVGDLDQRINDVGGPSAPALPLETTSAVSDLLHGILELLRAF